MTRRTPRRCACGTSYEEFRAGLTFAEARRLLWNQPDPNRPGWYRQKRRHSVLGIMRQYKLDLFAQIHGYCGQAAAA